MLKRPAEPIESPGFKRRCLDFRSSGSPLLAAKQKNLVFTPGDENTENNSIYRHKRPRTESYSTSSPRDGYVKQRSDAIIASLRTEMLQLRQGAEKEIKSAQELANVLRNTIGNQNREIERLNNENKILKGGIRALNKQKEAAVSHQQYTESIVKDQARKLQELEQALHALRALVGKGSCGASIGDPGWSGNGGPVF